MTLIFLGQVAIPVALVALLWVRPPRTRSTFIAQLTGTLLALGALAQVGIWLFPPWWVPYLTAILVACMTPWVWRRASRHEMRRTFRVDRLRFAGFALLGAMSAAIIVQAYDAGRAPSGVQVVDVESPLGAGRYLVVNGGGALLVNAHRRSTDTSVQRLRSWRGNAYGVDLVAISRSGSRAGSFQPSDPAAYQSFGTPVVAPCAGMVTVAVDGLPDMIVPVYDRTNPAGNHVILACDGFHIVLAHLRKGSVRVRAGAEVRVGDLLGEIGNSGGTDEPHLHVHAQRPGPPGMPMAGEPLPMRLNGRFLVRGDRFSVSGSAHHSNESSP